MRQLKCLNCGNPDLQIKKGICICPSCGSRFFLDNNEIKALEVWEDSDVISSDEEYRDYEFWKDIIKDSVSIRQYSHVPVIDAVPSEFTYDEAIFFVEDTNNRAGDKKAIRIINGSPGTAYVRPGFIRKQIREWLDKGWEYDANTDGVSPEGVTFTITFYRPFSSFRSIRTSLGGLYKKAGFFTRRENLASLIKGSLLEAEYDADSDAYVLSTDEGAEVGELSRTVAEMLEGMTEYYVVYDGDVHVKILY